MSSRIENCSESICADILGWKCSGSIEAFGREMTDLAEVVVIATTEFCRAELTERHGIPRNDLMAAKPDWLRLVHWANAEVANWDSLPIWN